VHVIIVWAFIGIISMHLLMANFIWRPHSDQSLRSLPSPSAQPTSLAKATHASDSDFLPLKGLAKLTAFTSGVWVLVGYLIPTAYTFVSDPFELATGFVSIDITPNFTDKIFGLTFGLPSMVFPGLPCLDLIFLPVGLFALGLLPYLARKGNGSPTLYLTLLTVIYFAFLFGVAGTVDVLGTEIQWIALWAVGGAIAGFVAKLAQVLVGYVSLMRSGRRNIWDFPSEWTVLGWIVAGATSAVVGLLFSATRTIASTRGHYLQSVGPVMSQTIACGLAMIVIIGILSAFFRARAAH
jgi:hypothetical protein